MKRPGCLLVLLVLGLLGWIGNAQFGDGSPGASIATTTPTESTSTSAPSASSTPKDSTPPAATTTPRTTTSPTPATRTVAPSTIQTRPGTALALLSTLTVKGRAPLTEYNRDLFGQNWADTDRNGCDQRNDTLRRDLTKITLKAGTRGCVVLRGTLRDPYTGQSITFARTGNPNSPVEIDHVVALADAWVKGAFRWSDDTRNRFANDTLNLQAVSAAVNSAKGAGDAATWLPANKAYRCAYVARQVAVKSRYDISVTRAEHDAIARILRDCPDEEPPTGAVAKLGGWPEASAATTPRPPTTTPPPKPTQAQPLVPAAPLSGGECPTSAPIKGNANSMIYHLPSGAFYSRTKAEECFATEEAAEAAGYRASMR